MEIRGAPARVFGLVSDLRLKARLNPNARVIRVELESDGPIGEGAVFYHRLQKGPRIVEYRSRCVRYEPPRLVANRGETPLPFQVTVTVEPTAEGCRLAQEETLEVTHEAMDALEPPPGPRSLADAIGLLGLFPAFRPLGTEVRSLQRRRLERRLARELVAWLEGIRAHLEREDAGAGTDNALAGRGQRT